MKGGPDGTCVRLSVGRLWGRYMERGWGEGRARVQLCHARDEFGPIRSEFGHSVPRVGGDMERAGSRGAQVGGRVRSGCTRDERRACACERAESVMRAPPALARARGGAHMVMHAAAAAKR